MAVSVNTLANGAAATATATATTASVSPTSGARVFLAYSWGGPTTGANMLTTLPTFGGTLSRTTDFIVMWNECGENFITQTDMGVGMVEMVGWSGTGTISITLPTSCLDILTFVWEVVPGGTDISVLCWDYEQGNSTTARSTLPNGNHTIGGYVSLFGNGAGGASRTHTPLGGKTEMTNSEIAEADGYLSMACGYDASNNTLQGDDANVSCAWGIIGWSLGAEPTRPYPVGPVGPIMKNTTTGTTTLNKVAHAVTNTDRMIVGRISADNAGTNGAISGLTPTDTRSNTWAVRSVNNDPGAANAGVTLYHAYTLNVGTALQAGDTITSTWGITTPAKSVCWDEWVKPLGSTAAVDTTATNTATGSSTTPSVTSGTDIVGELAIGSFALQGPNSDSYTADLDTTDGTFRRLSRVGTFNATAASNVKTQSEWKVVSGTTAQVYNPTVGTSRVWSGEILFFKFTQSVAMPTPPNFPITFDAAGAKVTQLPSAFNVPVDFPLATASEVGGGSGASVTPSTFAAVLALDTAGAKVSQLGAVFDNPVAFPVGTATGGASVTPSTIAATLALDAAGVKVSQIAQVVTAILAMSVANTGANVTPAALAVVAAFPAAVVSVGAAAATIALITDLLQAAPGTNVTVTPTTMGIIVTFPTPTVAVGGAGSIVYPPCIEIGGGMSLVVVMDD